MPDQYQSMSHSKWNCRYHVVFMPKYRRSVFLRKGGTAFGEDISRVGAPERVPDSEGTYNAGPRAHVYRDTTET